MASAVNAPAFTLFLILIINLQSSALSAPKVPCFFIFGDSLVDNGNNNQLATLAKVNYQPYGIDFPQGPTGRFTNGRTIVDFLAQRLGFKTYIPPFASAQGEDIINGVNYASGSSGIRSESGTQGGENIGLERQLVNHELTISRIAQLLGNETSAKQRLRKCLYYFSAGSNDYINNYFVPDYYPTSSIYTPEQYATILVQQYSHQLQTLYNLGARKVAVSELGPLGCIPAIVARGTNGSVCVDSVNGAVRLFNDKLKLAVDDLNNKLKDAEFVYVGAMDLRPTELFALGIRILNQPCCRVSNRTGLCIAGESPCPVRALYFFYDNFHPTQIVNRVAATAAYVDIRNLVS